MKPIKLSTRCESFSKANKVLWLMLALVCNVASALEPAKSLGLRRAEEFVAILSAPLEQRRDFVRDNFTPQGYARRGLEGLSEFLEQMYRDVGGKPPLSMLAQPDRVIVRFATPNGVTRMHVLLTPEPEAKINGIMLQPNDEDIPMPPPPAASATPSNALPAAPTTASLADRAQAAAAQYADGFSGVVIVAKHGKPVFAQAYGLANSANKRANTLDTPFDLASNNKMFTALVIARLVEQGKLNWNDKVGKYLPKWPQKTVRDHVTIAHLLTHTSGLGMYWGEQHDKQRDSLDTVSDYANLMRNDKPAAQPGGQFSYSNNGYVLLGLIAEKVSGKDYYQLVREQVYQRSGMTHSDHFRKNDHGSGIAIGYDDSGSANTAELALRGSPAGGGYASANDLLHFALALQAGKIVRPQTLATMTQGVVAMGPGMRYGYGFGVSADTPRHFGHLGGAPGAHAAFEIYPDSDIVVIVLANSAKNAREMTQALNASVAAGNG
jgi:CubicO group peptidase (beta-lactamase class C family)